MPQPTQSSDSIVAALQWRAAIKTFDAQKKIPAAAFAALEQSMVLAPSSFGLQPWKFVVVNDPTLRTRIRESAWNQSQVTDASHLVVFAARSTITGDDVERHMRRITEVRGVTRESLNGYAGMINGFVAGSTRMPLDQWNARQVYIALGFFMLAAANMGVDTCPMEGFDPAKVDAILGLPATGYNAVVMVAAGYRSADDPYSKQKKVRYPAEQIIERR
ncbi:MAG: NAD(P)H-dependent oxidoreductase [Phycisphaerales bacterium]|nr:NAD(P)H-dependent oxidoreductase [Phycisphaerales bacterium]